MLLDNERVCDYILELCCDSGLTSAFVPLTRNQSARQIVYREPLKTPYTTAPKYDIIRL